MEKFLFGWVKFMPQGQDIWPQVTDLGQPHPYSRASWASLSTLLRRVKWSWVVQDQEGLLRL